MPNAAATDWRQTRLLDEQIQSLAKDTFQADQSGEYSSAVRIAQECVAVASTSQDDINGSKRGYVCLRYLRQAFRNGRGIDQDQDRAFSLTADLAAADPDGDDTLILAEAYLDGNIVARNPVQAELLLWRVEHGTWSIYGDFWGMCKDCGDARVCEKVVAERVDRELTSEDKKQIAALIGVRFPNLTVRVRARDTDIKVIAIGFMTFVASSAGFIWIVNRGRRKHLH